MEKSQKGIYVLILIAIIFIIPANLSSQENEKTAVIQEKAKKAKLQQEKKELVYKENKKRSSEFQEQEKYKTDEILRVAQKSFDRSLNILNIVAGLIAGLVGLITLIFLIGSAFGFFEYRRWKKITKKSEADVKFISDFRNRMEGAAAKMRNETKKIFPDSLSGKPSKRTAEKYDEFFRKLDMYEVLGLPMEVGDYLKRGTYLLTIENYETALENFEKAIELEPDNIVAWIFKGSVLDNMERYEEALVAFAKGIELEPSNPMSWNFKADALRGLGRNKEALEALEKAMELKSGSASILYSMACLNSSLGNKEEALKHLSKAIELDPEYKETAKKEEDFKNLWEDEDFKEITS